MAGDPHLVGPRRSLVEDTERARLDPAGGLVVDARRSRPHYRDGHFLTARDLTADMRYSRARQSDLARVVGWGVVRGLVVRRRSGAEVTIFAGQGLTPAGESVSLDSPVTVDLLALRGHRLRHAHRRGRHRAGMRSGPYVLCLRPVAFTGTPQRGYPTEVHGQRKVEDHDIFEATEITLVPWPVRGASDPDAARRQLVRDVFVARSGRSLAPRLLPLAVVYLDGGAVRWVDTDLVRRDLGADATGPGLGLVPRGLRLSHVRQYGAEVREVMRRGATRFEAARYFDTLPPVGEVPAAAIDHHRFVQHFFPGAMDVDLAVVPRDELPTLIEDGLSLPPIDLLAGERELQGVSVLLLVAVGRDEFRQFQRALATVRRPALRQSMIRSLRKSRLPGVRQFLAAADVTEPIHAAWTAAWDHAVSPRGLVWYVRRRNLNYRAEIPGAVDAIDLGDLWPPVVVEDVHARRVVASEKDADGDIVALRNPNEPWARATLAEAVADIEAGRHAYYVLEDGRRTDVHVVDGPTRKYLRTDPDVTERNNLDDLPDA